MIVDANPLVLTLQNFQKRVQIQIFDEDENPIDASEIALQIQQLGGHVVLNDSFTTPPPVNTRIKHPATGVYYITFGDSKAPANLPAQTEVLHPCKYLFAWSVMGAAGTEEIQRVQTVEIISAFITDRVRAFRGQIDKGIKAVSVDPTDFCPLGYTDGMLLEYLRGGLTLINSYQPYPTFCSLEQFPDTFLQNLFDAALIVGVNAQTLFAIDSDVEQWCLVEGTLVSLADGSRRPIQEIIVGDRVIDRTGRVQTVQAAWNEGVADELVEIKLWGGRTIQSTPNHEWPIWAWIRECYCGCGTPVKPGRLFQLGHRARVPDFERLHVRGGKKNTPTRQSIPAGYEPYRRLRADEIHACDFLLVPRKFDPIETDVTKDEARLLGYYAAEGCPIYSRAAGNSEEWANLKFTFNDDERDMWIADIEMIATRSGFKTAQEMSTYAESTSVRTVSDRGQSAYVARLCDLAREHIGTGSKEKRLSEEVMRWPLHLKREFIIGLVRGDGHQAWDENEKNGYVGRSFAVHYSTSSPFLRVQVEIILAQLGFPVRLTFNKAKTSRRKKRHAGKEKRTIYGEKNFVLHVPSVYAFEFADLIWGDYSQSNLHAHGREGWAMPRPECMIDDDFICIPVKSIRTVRSHASVYNLTVSGDHSYLVEGIATFNSDQGNAFVINHQPKLAAFSAALAQRLDKIIPDMKRHFVRSGSVKVETGPGFRLNTLVDMAPSGAIFRNVFMRG